MLYPGPAAAAAASAALDGVHGEVGRERVGQGGVVGGVVERGSATLAKGLAAAGLVDRYHLLIFPVILGSGKRLFATEGADKQKLTLVEHVTYGNGVQMKVYDVVR